MLHRERCLAAVVSAQDLLTFRVTSAAVTMDVGQKFNLLEHVTWLACLTMEATCTFDDVDDKIQEVDGLLERLNVTRDELIEGHRILRKVMNCAHDLKNDLRQELLALAQPTPPASTGGAVVSGNLLEAGLTDTELSGSPEQLPASGAAGLQGSDHSAASQRA